MAKAMKASKGKFFIINQLMGKIPEEKFVEGSVKIGNFFRNVKAVLRSDLDRISDLQKAKTKKTEEESKAVQAFFPRLAELEGKKERSEEESKEMAELQAKFRVLNAQAEEKARAEIDEMNKIQEEINSSKKTVEVKFDNEDFNFMEEVFKKNAASLFKTDDGKAFNVEVMADIYQMFEDAYNPDSK